MNHSPASKKNVKQLKSIYWNKQMSRSSQKGSPAGPGPSSVQVKLHAKLKLPVHQTSKQPTQGANGSLSSLGHPSNGQALTSAGAMTCKAQHRNNICLRKRVSNVLVQSHASLAQKGPKSIFKVTKKQSTNEGLSDHRYSLPSQQKSSSELKRTASTAECDLSLHSSSNSRSSVVLPQIQYSHQNIKTTTPANARVEPRTQASRQLFSTIGQHGNLVVVPSKQQTVTRESRSSKKGGKGAAILFSEGRRKNTTTAASRDGSNSCVSDASHRETP